MRRLGRFVDHLKWFVTMRSFLRLMNSFRGHVIAIEQHGVAIKRDDELW
jgi:hypothetical protein